MSPSGISWFSEEFLLSSNDPKIDEKVNISLPTVYNKKVYLKTLNEISI